MIGWLIEERWAELLCALATPRRGRVRRSVPGGLGSHSDHEGGANRCSDSDLAADCEVWNDVRAARYDVAVDLQGAMRSAVLARWSGAPVILVRRSRAKSPASLCYTRQMITSGTHVIEQNLSRRLSGCGGRAQT